MTRDGFFDEMNGDGGDIRRAYQTYCEWLRSVPPERLAEKHQQADILFRRLGITFAVHGDDDGVERLIPFDVIPRILDPDEWRTVATGVSQRVRAINAFLDDIYHEQEILKAGRIPATLVLNNPAFRPEALGLDVPRRVYVHVAGIDVVRVGPDEFYVLEDNCRVPSGVSYMLENRETMMRLFPELFSRHRVAPVNHYPEVLLRTLRAVAPPGVSDPTIVVLTPGHFNSAYFEHAFLAREMGVELVEGQDLFVDDNTVFMRTTEGPQRVHVIYRRIDDDFIDPLAFNANSTLGVSGLLSVARNGRVALANAVGTGIADDKAVYVYVPEMISYYLGEKPILNNVPTYALRNPDDCAYVLDHLEELVVKEVAGAGGYGMLVGPFSTADQRSAFRAKILANPEGFIAQPTLKLSTCPTLVAGEMVSRHVDLRPYVLTGETTTAVPGGLTRVALREGSLVVNSSQGGGTKDTWILEG
ncbi:MAG: circularly permuted type 2 ATP-grasp protein [Rhodospirillales bacterium]|nr:MAG: circularly permuted type 2 ATP-grasp protein [Rhodospirillales bacterium]